MKHRIWLWGFLLLILWCVQAQAAEVKLSRPKNSLHMFGGQFTRESIGGTAELDEAKYEDNYILAIDYYRELFSPGWGAYFGFELGFGNRFGDEHAQEAWGAVAFRHQGWRIANVLTISPGLSFGVSLVDEAIGTEAYRENQDTDRDASLLFYLSPEIALSFSQFQSWELVYRLHHRSGADRTLGEFREGHNANTIGVRYWF
ncbi:MAG: hypothetical protein ACOC3Y_02600 [Desulfohalobiaceae bacterium]